MDMNEANETIAAAHHSDIEQARAILRAAIAQASDAWISSAAISDALMLEFIELAGRGTSPTQLATHLTNIANRLARAQERAH